MGCRAQYKTRQRERMLTYIKSMPGQHFTAADVRRHFQDTESPIGTTTVYRQLEKLVEEGLLKKYVIDECSSACFEYVDPAQYCHSSPCYHCKCEKCGKLIHMDCHEMADLQVHFMDHHHFKINPLRTVFYGLCEECLNSEIKE